MKSFICKNIIDDKDNPFLFTFVFKIRKHPDQWAYLIDIKYIIEKNKL